jgi:formate-dependent nitrite reductase membrane component NrfD
MEYSQPVGVDTKRVISRYHAVYLTASWIVFWGYVLIIGAIVVGVLIAIGSCVWAGYTYKDDSDAQLKTCVGGIFVGVSVAIPVIISGFFSLVAGQILRAFVDTAVNTSPLISNSQKAFVMGVN